MSQENTQSKQSAEEKAMEVFSELLIEKLESIQADWKKPWFNPNGGGNQWPRNLSGREYAGGNAIILSLIAEKNNYPHSIWATFDRINALNFNKDKQGKYNRLTDDDGKVLPRVCVNKGEKSASVWITTYSVVNAETKERIKFDDYKLLSEEERSKYNVFPHQKVYGVFNLDQTNMKEVRPDLYNKIVEKFGEQQKTDFKREEGGITEFPAFNRMMKDQLWICPVKEVPGDDAYYSISAHEIVVPPRENFKNYESFVGNTFHEMNHSVHSEKFLNLIKPASFNSSEYSIEELRSELGAAVLCNKFGMTKNIKSDSLPYIKSWLNNIHEKPEFLKSILNDVKRSASIIGQRIDRIQLDIDNGIESDKAVYDAENKAMEGSIARRGKDNSKSSEKEEQSVAQEEQTAKEVVRHGRGR